MCNVRHGVMPSRQTTAAQGPFITTRFTCVRQTAFHKEYRCHRIPSGQQAAPTQTGPAESVRSHRDRTGFDKAGAQLVFRGFNILLMALMDTIFAIDVICLMASIPASCWQAGPALQLSVVLLDPADSPCLQTRR